MLGLTLKIIIPSIGILTVYILKRLFFQTKVKKTAIVMIPSHIARRRKDMRERYILNQLENCSLAKNLSPCSQKIKKPKDRILNDCIRLTHLESFESSFKQMRSLNIYEGIMYDHTKVTVRNMGLHQHQLEFAKSLERHPNFIKQYFVTKDNEGHEYIIEEYYEKVLDLYSSKYDDLKQIFIQLSSALEYSKSKGIVIGNIKLTNVAVIKKCGGQKIYKITDFSSSFKANSVEDFQIDMKELVNLLIKYRKNNIKIECLFGKTRPRFEDEVMFTDLIYSMVKTNDRQTIEEIRKHPFSYDSEKILNLFVKAAQILESPKPMTANSIMLKFQLNHNSNEIISEDWINYIDKRMKNELNRIHREKTKNFFSSVVGNNIVDLIITIRNLHVHYKTDKIIELIGKSDNDLCDYWTKYFPELVLYVFYELKKINVI